MSWFPILLWLLIDTFSLKITLPHLRPEDDSMWSILQYFIYEGWRQPIELNANLHEIEKEISQKEMILEI